ncbi:MAG: hypothetical protein OEX97_03175 [Acidimicrobiia bacterium]|nr:hypothetical protein [Acidimicrobiia bacterium]
MRTEITKTYPVPLKAGFDYIDDFKMWPDWYVGMTEIIEPEVGQWIFAGDTVKFLYRLLGRQVQGVAMLDEKRDGVLARFHSEVPGLPRVHFEYHYMTAGDQAFMLKVVLETKEEELTSFFGKVIDRMMLPRVLERDLKGSLDNLEEIFVAGLYE